LCSAATGLIFYYFLIFKLQKMKTKFSKGVVLPLLMLGIISCNKSEDGGVVVPDNTPDISIKTSATLGQYLTNKQGQTLYMFANDADGLSTCTGACETLWPLFNVDLTLAKLDASLAVADFGSITTASGRKQTTYKGWPLYTYSPSSADGYGGTSNNAEPAGSTRGEGVNNVWFIAKPNYTIMLANKQLTGADGNNYLSNYTLGAAKTLYFTGAKGRTIYTFTVDSFNINKFTRPDFSNNATWPIYEQDQIVVPSILDKTLFGSITVAGKKQLTYKGWPLYYFGQDSTRGQNKGVSVPVPGRWPVAVKDLTEARR
jgi:predicted lipoprotein with Yx(FWY)xxD motif